jgi:hypothetical protein
MVDQPAYICNKKQMFAKVQSKKRSVMYPIIINYLRSGIKQNEFCDKNSITVRKFQYWYRRYKKELPSDNESSFIPIKFEAVPLQNIAKEELKICYPNGVVIQVQDSISEDILIKLISLI